MNIEPELKRQGLNRSFLNEITYDGHAILPLISSSVGGTGFILFRVHQSSLSALRNVRQRDQLVQNFKVKNVSKEQIRYHFTMSVVWPFHDCSGPFLQVLNFCFVFPSQRTLTLGGGKYNCKACLHFSQIRFRCFATYK